MIITTQEAQKSRAISHGIASGIRAVVQGGNFLLGFMSSFASTILQPIGAAIAKGNYYARVTFSAIIGGTVSVIGGGKFANGAVTSAFQFMYNDWLHDVKARAIALKNKTIAVLKVTYAETKRIVSKYGSRVVSVIGGTAQIAAGVGTCAGTSGAGCTVSYILVIHGVNNVYEGITGNDGRLRDAYKGLFGTYGNKAYVIVDIGVSLGTAIPGALGKVGTLELGTASNAVRGYAPIRSFNTGIGQRAIQLEVLSDFNTWYSGWNKK